MILNHFAYGWLLRVCVRDIARSKVRSSLTGLGIVVGVASVVAMLSIGEGARGAIEKEILRMNGSIVALVSIAGRVNGAPTVVGLTPDDYSSIRQSVPHAKHITLVLQRFGLKARRSGRTAAVTVQGVDIGATDVFSRVIRQGASFGASDVRMASNVCLLPATLAERLFPNTPPIAQVVQLESTQFLVIGVLEDRKTATLEHLPEGDNVILMPYTSLRTRLGGVQQAGIFATPTVPTDISELKQELLSAAEARRGNRRVQFRAQDVTDTVDIYTAQSRTMTLLLGAVASISLLVGGIGIMNIMVANIAERRWEIGIRSAIGTRRALVGAQFLVTGTLLSTLAGAFGLVVGIAVAVVLGQMYGWPIAVTPEVALLATLFGVVVGVAFSFGPAIRAAGLSPIEALRTER